MVTENGLEDNTKRSSDSESDANTNASETPVKKPNYYSQFVKHPEKAGKPKLEKRTKEENKRFSKLFRSIMRLCHSNQELVSEQLGISRIALNHSIRNESMSVRRFLDILDMVGCEFVIKKKGDDDIGKLLNQYGEELCSKCKYKSYYENMMNAQAQFEAKMLEDARAEAREHVKNLLMK